jgi:hypothetical protein
MYQVIYPMPFMCFHLPKHRKSIKTWEGPDAIGSLPGFDAAFLSIVIDRVGGTALQAVQRDQSLHYETHHSLL